MNSYAYNLFPGSNFSTVSLNGRAITRSDFAFSLFSPLFTLSNQDDSTQSCAVFRTLPTHLAILRNICEIHTRATGTHSQTTKGLNRVESMRARLCTGKDRRTQVYRICCKFLAPVVVYIYYYAEFYCSNIKACGPVCTIRY